MEPTGFSPGAVENVKDALSDLFGTSQTNSSSLSPPLSQEDQSPAKLHILTREILSEAGLAARTAKEPMTPKSQSSGGSDATRLAQLKMLAAKAKAEEAAAKREALDAELSFPKPS